MKTGRRSDSESLRREARDREVGRIHRKRPSMLSEFHGKHHSSHRDLDRDNDSTHFRSHGRYSYDNSDHSSRFSSSSGTPYGKLKTDPRGKRLYTPLASHHSNSRTPHYHVSSYSRMDSSNQLNDGSVDEEVPAKRPCLSVDVSRQVPDPPTSADSVASSVGGSSPTVAKTGLSAYLEDIISDEEEVVPKSEDPPLTTTVTRPPTETTKPISEQSKPTKEELLLMMERVDRDISALESQIASLQKKQAELEEGGSQVSPLLVTPSPKTPSPDISSPSTQTPAPLTTPDRQPVSKMSLVESIYSENRSKANSTHALMTALVNQSHTQTPAVPLYLQPSEAPFYHANIASHRLFRPHLIEYLRLKKLALHEKELSLCARYDTLMSDWDRKMERIEGGTKKKARDLKNRELFEKTFPELKARREQQERFTRVDQRGFGVVRSDAELDELVYELSNKESASARYRRTHAVIPPMILDDRPSRYYNTNSHVDDVMGLHRELKFTNIWTEEEKMIFREKFVFYPKNFEVIAKFLPNKSTPDCIKYYYLSKKSENFKQLVRKANLKRKKTLLKARELSLSTSSLPTTPTSARPPSLLPQSKKEPLIEESRKSKSEYGDWTEENIASLKEGLRKFGRAWGKVYREVGGSKTATQCKMFYDDQCSDESLGLQEALLEHSRMKNAEKLRRKSQSRKHPPLDSKRKAPAKPSPVQHSEEDSENTESATESDSNGDVSGSESTITNSGPEDAVVEKPPPKRPRGSRKSQQSLTSPTLSTKTSEDVVDLFLTAAEALKNNISPDIALHDHTYSLPPSQLANNMEGTSGLSLIAAAAAVVSPTLSRNAGSGKHPMVSPVRAPRGRPPNKYRGSGGNSTIKLSPTLLSPAGGSSANVLLSDIKNTAFRNRTRSAPADRPKSSTIHIPRNSSALARMSITSSTGRSKSAAPTLPPGKKGETSSLKSMIALQPSQGASSAFEALVNVAVAAPPAELPKTSTAVLTTRGGVVKKSAPGRGCASSPSPVGTISGKLTLSRSNSNDSNNSSLSNGATATAYIDVSQAINILATLAQQNPGSATGSSHTISVYPGPPLIAQAGGPSTIIGSFVSQGTPKQQSVSGMATSISATSNPVSVSATVDTLLSHLTSGVGKGSPRSTPSPKPANRTKKVPKTESVKTGSALTTTKSDDLSNLKLLSSLVAAVAATQSSPSVSTPSVDVSTVNTPTLVQPTPTTKTQGSPSSGQSHLSEHSNSTNCTPPLENHNNVDSVPDNLPRSVVRPNPYPPLSSRPPAVTGPDMTASLASIIPSYNPSVSQQSSLLLYTRSRTFPQSVDSLGEDEDTLESATRGISELSKLLGTEGNGEADSPTIVGKKGLNVNATDELENVTTNGIPMTTHDQGEIPNDEDSSSSHIKLNLSSLLESHGTVHRTSPGSHGNALSGESPLNVNTQSR